MRIRGKGLANLLDKIRLLGGLLDGERSFVGPFFATAYVTRRCNLHCPGCPHHQPGLQGQGAVTATADLSLSMLKAFVKGLAAARTQSLCLTGDGEPLLHPELPQMVKVAKEAGLEVTVQSNATRLDDAMARALCEAGLDVLRVSLWAAKVEDWKALHTDDSPAQFQAALDGVARLIKRRRALGSRPPRVVLHQPVIRAGVRRLSDLADLAVRLGCDGVSFGLVHDPKRAGRDLVPDVAEIEVVMDSLRRLRPFLDGHGLSHNLDGLTVACRAGEQTWQNVPCYIAWLHLVLIQDGTVRPCCRCPVPLGDLKTQPLIEIWNSPAARAFRRQARNPDGLARLAAKTCDCTFCPYVEDNARVHDRARWL